VQVPTSPAPGSTSQWLSFEGHWGQREAGYNTGPTGPNTKPQWVQPFTWMDEQRLAAPKLPGGALVGPAVTSAFCDTVAQISLLVNFQSRSTGARILLLAGAALLLAALVFLLKLTRWRPVETDPLRRRRAFGQLIAAAGGVYGRRWRVLLPMGLTSLLILGAFEGIAQLASELAGETGAGGFFGGPGGSAAPIGDTVNGLGQPVGFAIAGGAVISYLHLLEAGDAGIGSAYGLTLRRLGRLVGAQFAALLLILGLAVTVIGIPLAVKKLVDWQFVAQEVLFRDRSIREALRGSTEAVRAGWWWTARVVLFFWLIGVVTGPVLGFGLVFADFSLTAIDLLGSLVFALLLPYVATGRTLLYLDLLSREPAPAKPARTRWKPWRREPSAQPG
jgi:hypothetical protein